MTVHRAELDPAADGPIVRDIVVRREGTTVTLAQAPGLPQLVFRTLPEAVRVASAFAAAHGVDVWCAVGARWSLVATHRLHGEAQQMPRAPAVHAGARDATARPILTTRV